MAQRHLLLPCVFVLSFALPVVGEVESKGPSMTREDIFKAVQSLSREKDLFSASEFVLGLRKRSQRLLGLTATLFSTVTGRPNPRSRCFTLQMPVSTTAWLEH